MSENMADLSPSQICWGKFYALLHIEAQRIRQILAELANEAEPEQDKSDD